MCKHSCKSKQNILSHTVTVNKLVQVIINKYIAESINSN